MKELILDTLQEKEDIRNLISSFSGVDPIDISISYNSDFRNAKKLRTFVEALCVELDVSPKWRSRLILVCDELNNNAIEYWSKEQDINIFRIVVKQKSKGQLITLSVSDAWSWKNAKSADEMYQIQEKFKKIDYSDHKSIRWRWLFLIISKLVDRLDFHDVSNWWLTVEIEKNLV